MMSEKKVLVTGSSGFVGSRLISVLVEKGWKVRALLRKRRHGVQLNNVEFIEVPDIASQEKWGDIMQGCGTVIHLAARVHTMAETSPDPLAEYTLVNTVTTKKLASAAADTGVKRFVFLSSIKASEAFPSDDHYSYSKAMAEKALQEICTKSDMEYVIIRPPLIYGPGVKANFRKLIEIVDRGIPLPLASVKNKRSFLGLGNLVDFIIHALDHPSAANRTYSISDGEDLSTPELVRRIAAQLGKKSRLFPCPETILNLVCMLTGKRKVCERLIGSLLVDLSPAKKELQWRPIRNFDLELQETIQNYLENK